MICKNIEKRHCRRLQVDLLHVPQTRFFGVGPITNMTVDEVDRRLTRFEFEAWLENNYQKLNDRGQKNWPCDHR